MTNKDLTIGERIAWELAGKGKSVDDLAAQIDSEISAYVLNKTKAIIAMREAFNRLKEMIEKPETSDYAEISYVINKAIDMANEAA